MFLPGLAVSTSWSSLSCVLLLRFHSEAILELILLNEFLLDEFTGAPPEGEELPELFECEPILWEEKEELNLERNEVPFSLEDPLELDLFLLGSLLLDRLDEVGSGTCEPLFAAYAC